MVTIVIPILLIGRERVAHIGGGIGMSTINGAQRSAEWIVEVACERCKNHKSEDQHEKAQDDIRINRVLSFCMF